MCISGTRRDIGTQKWHRSFLALATTSHIINLEHTVPLYRKSCEFVKALVANHGTVLFVGTKRSAGDAIREQAERCGMPFVSHRWLGGMLTNFKTIKQSIKRLEEIEEMERDGTFESLLKKEVLGLTREQAKLERTLGGIKNMDSLPDAVFVIDVGHEKIAVHESKILGIPVVGVVDTNCSPDEVDYIIPGNDDAMRAARLFAEGIAEAVLAGKASLPALPVGEDDFVELDAEGNPKAQGAMKPRAAKTPVRKKRKPAAALAPVEAGATEESVQAVDAPEPADQIAASGSAEVVAESDGSAKTVVETDVPAETVVETDVSAETVAEN